MKTEDTEKNKIFEMIYVTVFVIIMLVTTYGGVRYLLNLMQLDYKWSAYNRALNKAVEMILQNDYDSIEPGVKLYEITEFNKTFNKEFFSMPVRGEIKINVTEPEKSITGLKKIVVSIESQLPGLQYIKPVVIYISSEK